MKNIVGEKEIDKKCGILNFPPTDKN